MEFVSLGLFALAVVGLGAAATVLLTRWVPTSVARQAALHGRFADLGDVPAAVPAASYRPAVRKEAMNVVGTSN
ncbi:hypothetical protein PXJ20_20330 [Paraburkholderia sp. A1RI_3L]|uniref:hypothetical protein n=1 Tax=Paraburkholderia TaxID=1822464 RepID=UPI00034B5F2D|nr:MULTISPECIES: hypothetical protein [Paraburkholderia]WEY41069.1 hypothetical protein P2869_26680 [Paraburkholderia sp. SUR17]